MEGLYQMDIKIGETEERLEDGGRRAEEEYIRFAWVLFRSHGDKTWI